MKANIILSIKYNCPIVMPKRRTVCSRPLSAAAAESSGIRSKRMAGVWLCLICCVRKRIMLAIGIVKESARSIAQMPAIILFPILQCAGLFVFVIA